MSKILTIVNGIPTLQEVSVGTAYDESIYYESGLAAETPITLPNSGYFTNSSAKDILVIANDLVREITIDFTIVDAGPNYTQIQFNYALPTHSRVRFKQNI